MRHFQAIMCRDLVKNSDLSGGGGREPKIASALNICVGVFDPPLKSILIDNGDHGHQNSEVCWQFTSTDL